MQTEIDFTVHPNSITVYREKIEPTLKGRKLEVLNAIKAIGGKATMYEVAEYINRPMHTISGRFGELVKMNLIYEAGEKTHHENNFTVWCLVSE